MKTTKKQRHGLNKTFNSVTKNQDQSRQARPMGLTMIAIQFQQYANLMQHKPTAKNIKHQTKQDNKPNNDLSLLKEKLIHKLIQYVLDNKLTIGDKPISLDNLGTYLNIPQPVVLKHYINYTNRLNKSFNNTAGDMSGALNFFILNKILESKASIGQQKQVLTMAQDGQYKPFISSSVNDILNIELGGIKVMMDYYRMLNPAGPNMAFIQQNNNIQNNTAIKAIGVGEAMKILEDQNLLGLSANNFKQLPISQQIPNLPEVRANFQHGNKDDAGLVKSSKLHHARRRVKDEGLDEEELI